jgi:hypothetical protein
VAGIVSQTGGPISPAKYANMSEIFGQKLSAILPPLYYILYLIQGGNIAESFLAKKFGNMATKINFFVQKMKNA